MPLDPNGDDDDDADLAIETHIAHKDKSEGMTLKIHHQST
jgi:hypothetical protein